VYHNSLCACFIEGSRISVFSFCNHGIFKLPRNTLKESTFSEAKNCMCGQIQGSTLTFQLTSPVASDSNNLDVTGQNLFFF